MTVDASVIPTHIFLHQLTVSSTPCNFNPPPLHFHMFSWSVVWIQEQHRTMLSYERNISPKYPHTQILGRHVSNFFWLYFPSPLLPPWTVSPLPHPPSNFCSLSNPPTYSPTHKPTQPILFPSHLQSCSTTLDKLVSDSGLWIGPAWGK